MLLSVMSTIVAYAVVLAPIVLVALSLLYLVVSFLFGNEYHRGIFRIRSKEDAERRNEELKAELSESRKELKEQNKKLREQWQQLKDTARGKRK